MKAAHCPCCREWGCTQKGGGKRKDRRQDVVMKCCTWLDLALRSKAILKVNR